MKKVFWLLVLAFAFPALAQQPPRWDVSNTYWTAQIRDVLLGFTYDGNIRFFSMNPNTGEFTGRVQYLPPNLNPLGQYNVSGRVEGDNISFRGIANIPGVGNTDVVWVGSVTQNGARMEGQMAYWDWIWGVWVTFTWRTTSGGPARPIVRTYTISGRVTLEEFGGDVTTVPVTVQLRPAGSTNPIRTVVLNLGSGGSYAVSDVPNGTYDLAFKASHWLRRVARNVTVSGANVGGVSVSLPNGDIDGDNEVSLLDFGRLVAAFGTQPGDANWNPNADLDGDADVSLLDFGVLVRSFGLVGEE
ncbi:MAG: hypothetical protein RMK92_05475 [Armatimonadota bacterium]|nr:hypothetical protein [Armatimonadota bacterium]MDW8104443.1 hypothetical protein [Armatimonadota bacterium]